MIFAAVAIVLAAASASGQEGSGDGPEKQENTNSLRIANEIDLTSDLARLDSLEKQKKWGELAVFCQELLPRVEGKVLRNSDGAPQPPSKKARVAGSVYVSAGEAVRERLVRFGPRAREAYRIRHDGAAGRAFARLTSNLKSCDRAG